MKKKKSKISRTPRNTRQQYASIEEFLQHQQQLDILRFITCGSVDDGKSTLIGRLLWEAQQLFEDQIINLKQDSKKFGTQGEEIDFALLVDGLSAEREQGITIDVAYRYFATNRRKFIVADTPGHEQYTRNMITGASTADLAIILIDANNGIVTQTRRHAYLASRMGVNHILLAINKMDRPKYSENVFTLLQNEFQEYSKALNFHSVIAIPVSALRGDNISQPSPNMPWYKGATLLEYLETINIQKPCSNRFIFPVQWVNRTDPSFRGYSGSIAEGSVQVGNPVRITSSGQKAHITRIITMDDELQSASQDEAITLVLDREIDISRGDLITLADQPLETSDQFEATIIWMSDDIGLCGRMYDLKLATQWTSASITAIKHRININTLTEEPNKTLTTNDVCVCNITTHKSIAFDSYNRSKTLGGFILVDRYSHATLAVGLIHHGLRRANNIHKQSLTITKTDREKLNGHKGKVIWFTGLSGSGKSTLANALEIELHKKGYRTYLLDGDNVRHGLNRDLGFTDADRVENIRRVIEVAKLMLDAGLIVITAFISPFAREREMAKELLSSENFIEIYLSTPLEICEKRDPKGLYQKARTGQLPNLSGIGSSYEIPENPALKIDSSKLSIEMAVQQIISLFSKHNL